MARSRCCTVLAFLVSLASAHAHAGTLSLSVAQTSARVLYRGDSASLQLTLRNDTAQACEGTLTLSLTDFHGTPAESTTVTVSRLAPSASVTLSATLLPTQVGYFSVNARLTNGASTLLEQNTVWSLAVFEPGDDFPLDSPFGTYTIGNVGLLADIVPKGFYHNVAQMGARWGTIDTWWSIIESTQGTYNWAFYDPWFNAARQEGVTPIPHLFGIPQWLSTNPTASDYWAYPPRDWNAWDRFVTDFVTHYRSWITYLRIWNEANVGWWKGTPAQYGQLVIRASQAAKRVKPDIKIIIDTVSDSANDAFVFLNGVAASGASPYWDVNGLHNYWLNNTNYPERTPYIGVYENLVAWTQQQNPTAEAWDTEFACMAVDWADGWWKGVGETKQAQWLARAHALGFSLGLSKMFWFPAYSWPDDTSSPYYNPAGLLRVDLSPRPAYVAYHTTAVALSRATYHSSLTLGTDQFARIFQTPDGYVTALWSVDSAHAGQVDVYFRPDAPAATLMSLMGTREPRTPATDSGKISVAISEDTVFLLSNALPSLVPLPPSATLSTTISSPTNSTAIPVTIVFSTSVTGLTTAGLSVTNGTASNLTGSGARYTATVVPSLPGMVSVQLIAGAARDSQNLVNTASNILTLTFDNVSPTVELSTNAAPTTDGAISVLATLSENSTDFSAQDLAAQNATINAFIGTGRQYTFTATPLAEGTFSCEVTAGIFHDQAGNGNLASSVLSRTYDAPPLTLTLASTATDPTNAAPIPVQVAFSRTVGNFSANDVQIANATLSEFIGSADHYSFVLTPSGPDVVVSAFVPAAAVHGPNNEPNEPSNRLSRHYDTTAPSAPLVAGPAISNTDRPQWTWTAGTGGASTFRLSLDAVSGPWTQTGSTSFIPPVALADGVHTLYVQERDLVGNWSASGSFAVRVDTQPPNTPTISALTPIDAYRPTWNWSSGGPDGQGLFRYSLDSENGPWNESRALAYTPPDDLPQGRHTLYVQERDEAANWSASATFTLTIVPNLVVSGQVTRDGIGMRGVVLAGLPGSPTTDANGNYSLTVPLRWSGSITPQCAGFSFVPSFRSANALVANRTGQDFTAACTDIVPPADVAASDGTHADRVRVTWAAIDGAIGYLVCRCETDNPASGLSLTPAPVNALSFDDTTASPAQQTNDGTGCNPNPGTVTYHRYRYWVAAVGPCSTSPYSTADEGYRGLPPTKLFWLTTRPIEPTAAPLPRSWSAPQVGGRLSSAAGLAQLSPPATAHNAETQPVNATTGDLIPAMLSLSLLLYFSRRARNLARPRLAN